MGGETRGRGGTADRSRENDHEAREGSTWGAIRILRLPSARVGVEREAIERDTAREGTRFSRGKHVRT